MRLDEITAQRGTLDYAVERMRQGFSGPPAQICYNYAGRVLRHNAEALEAEGAEVVFYAMPRLGYIHVAVVTAEQRFEDNIDPRLDLAQAGQHAYPVAEVLDWLRSEG
jgi:hypothetical protein